MSKKQTDFVVQEIPGKTLGNPIATTFAKSLSEEIEHLKIEVEKLRRSVRGICLGIVGMTILMLMLMVWGAIE